MIIDYIVVIYRVSNWNLFMFEKGSSTRKFLEDADVEILCIL